MKIKKISLSKLLKLELRSFIEKVISIISTYDTKALHLHATFQLILDQRPNIDLLKDLPGPNILTEKLNESMEECLNYAAIINSQLRIYARLRDEKTRRLVSISRPKVLLYLNYLRQNNTTNILGLMSGFFIDLENNPEIKEALIDLGLGEFLQELQNARMIYDKVESDRLDSKAQRPKMDSKVIQKELQHLLRTLFNQIDHYQGAYKELDYQPMINKLNELIPTYTNIINTRATVNKKKAANAKKAKQTETSTAELKANEPSTKNDVQEQKVIPGSDDNEKPKSKSEGEEKSIEKPIKSPLKSPKSKDKGENEGYEKKEI